MKFQPVAAVGALFCARDASASGMFTCYHSSNDGSIRIDRGTKKLSNQTTSNSKVSTGNDYLLTADYGNKTATIVLSGGGVDLFGKALGGANTYTVGSTLALFAMHSNHKSYSSFGTDHIYYFELYDSSGNLKHCLLPAQRNTDSVYGFYDTRTEKFYPQSGGALTAAGRIVKVTDTCKKWTGRGDGVSMSDGANWEGGVVPIDGDNLDFTLAAPLAEIKADIEGVTFGKLWIDDGDIPTFTGSLTVSGCNNSAKVAGNTSVVFLAGNYTWRGTETNWGDADAWTLDNAAATWADNNNAIFNTVDATATLTVDATANSLAFNQNATVAVAGSATLTVPSVVVAADVSATISAPTAGALTKTGAGTLTLTENRTDAATTLSQGTLAMSGGETKLDWSKFTFGTDHTKSVALHFKNGATLTGIPSSWYVGNVPGVTATLVKDGGEWKAPQDLVVGTQPDATTTFIHKGGTLSVDRYFLLGRDASANLTTLEISGGKVSSTETGGGCFMQIGTLSDARVVVRNGAEFSVADRLVIGGEVNSAANGTLDIEGGTVTVADDLLFGYNGTWSGKGTVNLGTDGILQLRQVRFIAGDGDGNTFNFDGGTLKARSATTEFIKASDKLTVNVSENGGTIDNNGLGITIRESFNGPGTINLTGSGATTFAAGVGAEGGVSVAGGTTLALDGGSQSSFGVLTLEAGSKLDIAAPASDVAAFAATKLNLPAEGAVKLTKSGGAFGEGVYAICRNSDVTVAEVEERFDFDITDMRVASWSKVDDLLVLTVKVIERTWIAEAGESFPWSEGWGENGWSDGVDAIFETAGAIANVDDDVAANSVKFKENAAINGESTLTPNIVHVAEGKEATINAPTAGALTKTGAGTLTLTKNRTDAATTLSEGTLALSGTASLDWSKFTFGTDPAKPVKLDFGPEATVSGIGASATWNVGDRAAITSVLFKAGGNWTNKHFAVGRASGAVTTFINAGGDMMAESYFMIGHDGASASTLVVSGGTVGSTSSSSMQVIVGNTSEGTLVVTNSGVVSAKLSLSVAHNANGTVNVSDGGFVHSGGDIVFHYGNANGCGVINLGRGGVIEAGLAYSYRSGLASFNFDGGTYRQIGNKNFFSANDTGGAIDVTVSENGGTLDNNGFTVGLPRTITGEGGMTLSGSGTTTVSADQSYTGTTTVSNETTLSIPGGVTFAGPVVFETGAAFDIASATPGVASMAAASLAFPATGTVPLTFNGGAFAEGIYTVCSAPGLEAADGEKFSLATEDGIGYSWSVEDDTLVLTVGYVDPNVWTGRGGDGRMSTPGNWGGNAVPAAGADIDLSGISADTTIIADAGRTFGAVTMGSGVVTFTNSFAAASFSDTSKIAVGADSTVTIEGDLVFSWPDASAHPICNNVAAGGVFRVTGSIIADSANRGYIVPCPGSIAGTIAAGGLVNNSRNSDDAFRLVRGKDGSSVNWEIGAAGISGAKRFVVSDAGGSYATIKAAANFTVSATIVQYRSLTLDTAGYTITLDANTPVKAGGILPASSAGLTTIAGSGAVVANYDVDVLSTLAGSKVGKFTVANGATLALKPGSNLGTGPLTVEVGGALKVAESGAVTLGGDLILKNGATLTFNFTKRTATPQMSIAEGKTLTVEGEVKVKIPADSKWPTAGEKVLTTCGGFTAEKVALVGDAPKWVRSLSVNADGNIVLDVKPMGTNVIVR
jgi:autotransporter-associated beta strand protein